MFAFFIEWAVAIWNTLCDAGPYLVLGLALAGFIQALVPREKIFRWLGKDDFKSVLAASIAGIPVPLCSCAVIPTAMQIRKSGASKGATAAFLISTPETGVDSIGVTWALFDPIMTIARPLGALLTALATGSAVNWFVRRKWDGPKPAEDQAAHEPVHAAQPEQRSEVRHETEHGHAHGEGHAHEPAAAPRARRGFVATSRAAFGYAFGALLDDISGWLIAGFVASGLILVVVPDDFFGNVLPVGWPSMLAMLVIGIPLYVCASATTPVAAALVAKGLDPGAALVLLLAGPATNLATMGVVSRFLGKRVLAVYLAGILVFSLVCGAIVNRIYLGQPLKVKALQHVLSASPGPIAIAGGLVAGFLLVRSAQRMHLLPNLGARLRSWCAPLGFDPSSRAARALGLLGIVVLYASTAFTAVHPGETAFVLRFGALCTQQSLPGLIVHAPFPIDRVERLRTDEVRSATFGFEEGAALAAGVPGTSSGGAPGGGAGSSGRDRTAESEIVAGDETLLRITYAVHYRVSDARKFRFGLDDADKALRAAAESSARRMVGHRKSEALLVESREAMQQEMLAILRQELSILDVGIEPLSVHLVYVHVPQRVHGAYLDVASALEDKEGSIRDAEKYKAEREAQARGRAKATEENALAESTSILEKSKGESSAFAAVREAHAEHPDLDKKRRLRETLAKTLKSSTLVLLLAQDVDVRFFEGSARDASRSNEAQGSQAPELPVPRDDR